MLACAFALLLAASPATGAPKPAAAASKPAAAPAAAAPAAAAPAAAAPPAAAPPAAPGAAAPAAAASGAAAAPAPAAPAPSAAPTLDEIVRRASAVQEKKPQKAVCKVLIRASLLGRDGKEKEAQELERSERWEAGKGRHGPLTKVVADGKPASAAELAEANADDEKKQKEFEERQARGEGQELGPVFGKVRVEQTTFKLLREEALGGRRCYVLAFAPKPGTKDGRMGTAWIDAETFLPVQVLSQPKPLPEHVDLMNLEESQQLSALGEVLPSRLSIEGAGGFLFLRRHFRLETRWVECKAE
jgi:hypothetical protein